MVVRNDFVVVVYICIKLCAVLLASDSQVQEIVGESRWGSITMNQLAIAAREASIGLDLHSVSPAHQPVVMLYIFVASKDSGHEYCGEAVGFTHTWSGH